MHGASMLAAAAWQWHNSVWHTPRPGNGAQIDTTHVEETAPAKRRAKPPHSIALPPSHKIGASRTPKPRLQKAPTKLVGNNGAPPRAPHDDDWKALPQSGLDRLWPVAAPAGATRRRSPKRAKPLNSQSPKHTISGPKAPPPGLFGLPLHWRLLAVAPAMQGAPNHGGKSADTFSKPKPVSALWLV